MTLYLARHCSAVHPIEDPARPLSADGREQARRLATFLPRAIRGHAGVDEILHSGVLRARQTAAILAEALHPVRGTRQAIGLAPEDNARAAFDALRFEDRSILVVTHQPLVATIAALLLGQTRGHNPVVYRTGTIAAFEGGGDHRSLEWVIHPGLLPGTRGA